MEASMYDRYVKDRIMTECESYFIDYLKRAEVDHEKLSDDDISVIENQLDYLLTLVNNLLIKQEEPMDAFSDIVDQLIGYCILGKMNEARLCDVINKMLEEKED
jgi:hypothetical protein